MNGSSAGIHFYVSEELQQESLCLKKYEKLEIDFVIFVYTPCVVPEFQYTPWWAVREIVRHLIYDYYGLLIFGGLRKTLASIFRFYTVMAKLQTATKN